MLNKQMQDYILELLNTMEKHPDLQEKKIDLFKEEKEYVEKNRLISDENITIEVKDAGSRFSDAYIERSDKETEDLIAKEDSHFLHQPIAYLNAHKSEFIYVESKWFDIIGVDAISLEADDVFEVYSVLFGLKLKKKYELTLRSYLANHLHGEDVKFNILFNDDGIWDMNIALNYIDGFHEELSIGEAYCLIYQFLFNLVEAIENE
ncbi:branched-chain amino acid aminotransferase [Lederbergia citrea]|uniref:Branched-chain amino acid aminotransferase n=1 Tax=Lederbergia citrea TaxID=2833581 RepID=A0A942Z4L7_9BACI|nr:branched-chain amino acid aminotransferase [Lederbergia citrea]MBS4203401.1 branched-chain amino acid aminotransferase [Lederbergia citrea]MBS4221926.1 branched-chain amino acid aminotransferase [Lederbergia citrea]